MAKYDLERAIVHALNENVKDSGDNIRFDFTSRRASAADLKACSGIDKIKVSMKNKKPFMNVMLYKNFTDAMGGWQGCLSGMATKVKKAVMEAGLGQTYDVAAKSIVTPQRKSEESSDVEGRISKESQMSEQLSAIAGQLMIGDFDDLEQSALLKKFIMVMRSGDAVLIPEHIWKSVGLNKAAAQSRIQIYRQDPDSKVLAIARQDLQKVCESMKITLTEDLTINVKGTVQQLVTDKLAPLTPKMNEEILTQTKQFTDQINLMNSQLNMLKNPDQSYKKLLDTKNGITSKDGKVLQEPQVLSDSEKRMLNLLTAVVEKNMFSMLNKKRQDLEASISALNASRNAKEAKIRGSASAEGVDDPDVADVIQIIKQKAGNYKYYLALYFNGQAVKF